MKRLLLLGTIAAMALTTTGQAQSLEQRNSGSRVVTRHPTASTTVAPSTNRNVVRSGSSGRRYYYGSNRFNRGYYPYSYNRPFVSVGLGGYYDYPAYGYGYGYPSNYGYVYPSDYYGEYPAGYTSTSYTTSSDLAYDDNIVAAVQERLKRAGYYLGAIDGVAGPETRSAVARWEGNHGMLANGQIDDQTLRSLGISA